MGQNFWRTQSWVERKTNKRTLDKIGSRKSMAERRMRFLGHMVQKNSAHGKMTNTWEDGKQAAKGEDLQIPGSRI